jgi:CheY-like chemotaxis protein
LGGPGAVWSAASRTRSGAAGCTRSDRQSRVCPTRLPPVRCDDSFMSTSVLIVDDDASFRALAVRLLRATDLEVVGQADTAAAALSAARDLEPAAALVDVGLPDRDGVTLARELTGLPWHPRVLLMSVDADAAGPDEVRRSGAAGLVHKSELPNAALDRILGDPRTT